ncbi:MAG: DUF6494 family protein [Pseudomonadota bacterium]
MTDDAFNMSMRKFLKQVGVTSQQKIEEAVRGSGASGSVKARAVITLDGMDMEHVVEGEIDLPGGGS